MAKRPIHFEVIEDCHVPIIGRLTGSQRVELAWQMWGWARDLIQARLIERHPEWDQVQLGRETARRMARDAG